MRQNQLHNIDKLRDRRKKLRSEMTPAEAFLWKHLQGSKLEGRKFRRQHSVGRYILDFYCSTERLSVELDGMHHFTDDGLKKDKDRFEYLDSLGIREIRFENAEVFEMTEEVLKRIKSMFQKITTPISPADAVLIFPS